MSKKITQVLVITVLALGLQTVKASEKRVFNDVDSRNYPPVDYRYADPIVFMERGIEFYVFPNGEFDFNTVRTTAPRSRNVRGNVNATYGASGSYSNTNYYNNVRNNGTKIEHDYMGRVRRIGNVFINYDNVGRVKRVGSVYMTYNSFALSQVGGLRIIYDRRGRIIDIIGVVNGYSTNYPYNSNNYYPSNNNNNGYGSGYYDDENNDDDDYYYYRQDGTKAKMSNEDKKEIEKKD
ncbi:MAG: hypothetical protein HC854_01465 [Flavobacterium sp.]|nr:hypothetical protein [Flavobacterium sp.]